MGKFALLIGVSDYAEGLSALPAATQDAAALQRVLQSPELGQFDDVQLLLDPTRDQMATKVEVWLSERQSEDLVLLFFSGHGVKDEHTELYFAAGNTQKAQNRLVRSTAFAARNLNDYLRDCRSKQQVVVLDCCFSGAFGNFQPRDDGEVGLQSQLAAEGRVVLTSTSAVDYAFEEKAADLSVYTRYLIEGIEKGTADLNRDGVITVDELHEFASRKVKETAPAMSPEIITLEGQGYKIEIARAPQDKPELRYRKEVEKKARKGVFTKPALRTLKLLRQQYGLSDQVAEAIEAEVLKPFRDYQRKLNDYRETLAECLEDGESLSRYDLIDLKDHQQHLNLKDEDVAPVERELLGQVIALEPLAPPVNPNRSVPSAVQAQQPTFSFKTVRVNEQGEEVETVPGRAEYFAEDLGNGVTLDTVRIPGGKFLMGAAKGEEGASDYEYPQHKVTVPDFWMGKYAVTQEQWQAVAALSQVERSLNADPAHFKGRKRPVECVSWEEAMEFCKRLSQRSKREYTLPSEAQWEYACRARTTAPFHFGPTITSDLANYRGTDWLYQGKTYSGNYGKAPKGAFCEKTTEVGVFSANPFGLHDMHGNVWEWCLDDWHDSYESAPTDGSAWVSSGEMKVLRGGSWDSNPANCRAAIRLRTSRDLRLGLIGFRVISVVPRT